MTTGIVEGNIWKFFHDPDEIALYFQSNSKKWEKQKKIVKNCATFKTVKNFENFKKSSDCKFTRFKMSKLWKLKIYTI